MPAAMDGEPTGRLEALELAVAEGTKARAAAATASSMAIDQWSPSNAAQVCVQGGASIQPPGPRPLPPESPSLVAHCSSVCPR